MPEKGTLTVYTASAGSGKTYTLAAEYIALLLQGNRAVFRHILAVTFTNKATAEMKERIMEYLYDMGYNALFREDSFFIKVKELLAQQNIRCSDLELQERARLALSDILHDFDAFRIETIDSFFQSLLTDLAHELGLSSTFRLELNDKEIIKRAIDRLIIKAQNNSQDLKHILRYVEKKFSEDKNWDFRKELQEFAYKLLAEEFLKHSDAVTEEMSHLDDYEQRLYHRQSELTDGLFSTLEHLSEQMENYGIPISNEKYVHSFIARVHEGDLKPMSASLLKKTENADAWLKSPEKKKGLYGTEAEELRSILAHANSYLPILRECSILLDKIAPLRLLEAVNKEMSVLNEEENLFLLKNTPQLFAQLIKADADFVFERSGTRFNHVMIDEFQDTSRLQWQNFKTLLLENISAGHKNMVVGDIKQSIYRWRNGDWKILGNIKEEAPFLRVDEQTLEQNHRSGRAIVAFNNELFVSAATYLEAFNKSQFSLEKVYQHVAQKAVPSKGEGYVRLYLHKKSKEEDAEAVRCRVLDDMATEMRRLNAQGVSYRDMAILVRRNKETPLIIQYFQKTFPEIPLVSPLAFRLDASPAVQMLVNALQTLNFQYTAEKKAEGKLKRMTSLVFLAKEYQQHIGRSNNELIDMMQDVESALPLRFRQERETLRKLPLFELCESLIDILDLDKMEGQAPYVFFFLDCVLKFLNENASNIATFLEHWEDTLCEKTLPVADYDGVQVTTVHKSKGLAFPAVFLPFAEWELEDRRHEIIHWTHKTSNDGKSDEHVTILPINIQLSKIKGTHFEEDYKEECFEMFAENLNTAYVAFTRPRTHLYIWSKVTQTSSKKNEDPAQMLSDVLLNYAQRVDMQCNPIDTIEHEPYILERGTPTPILNTSNERQVSSNPLKIVPNTEYIELEVHNTHFDFKQSNDSQTYLRNEEALVPERNEYLLKGNLLHEIFSHIQTIDDVRGVIENMNRKGLFSSNVEADELRAQVEEYLRFPAVQEWFDGSWQLFNECTILTRTATGEVKQLRPDRVMTKTDSTIVVDYKFGKPHPKYYDQILQYVRLLESMGHKNVSGYIWYVFSDEIETVQA